jgi:hypothetical protein
MRGIVFSHEDNRTEKSDVQHDPVNKVDVQTWVSCIRRVSPELFPHSGQLHCQKGENHEPHLQIACLDRRRLRVPRRVATEVLRYEFSPRSENVQQGDSVDAEEDSDRCLLMLTSRTNTFIDATPVESSHHRRLFAIGHPPLVISQ